MRSCIIAFAGAFLFALVAGCGGSNRIEVSNEEVKEIPKAEMVAPAPAAKLGSGTKDGK